MVTGVPEPAVAAGTTPGNPRETASSAPGQALHAQLLKSDSSWSGAVTVDGGITVGPNATLTIQPGTIVRFAKGAGIIVQGRIVVDGTPENPIRLTSLFAEPQESDWSGIILAGSEKRNSFKHVVIAGAETAIFARFSAFSASYLDLVNSAVGMRLQSATVNLERTTFAVPLIAVTATNSDLFMERCAITGGQTALQVSSSAVEARELIVNACRLTAVVAAAAQLKFDRVAITASQTAMRLEKCSGSVIGSRFSDNGETGVVLSGSNLLFTGNRLSGNRIGIQIDDPLPALWANTIIDNSVYNLLYLGEEPIFVGGNTFGDGSASGSDQRVFSKRPGTLLLTPEFAAEPPAAVP